MRIIRGVILAVVLVAAVFMVLRLLEYKQGSDTYASLSAEMTHRCAFFGKFPRGWKVGTAIAGN